MNNLIIGNGVNIQFGGLDYTNKSIIERALFKLKTGDYSKEVYTTEIDVWIKLLFQAFPSFLNGDYDKLTLNSDEKEELSNFKKRYNRKTHIYEIGFEDFFLLSELHCRKNDIGDPEKGYFREFLRRLFLDSIYFNGKVNNIYKDFSPSFIQFTKSFDNIFTTNYDRNIELGIKLNVFYLHGAFHILDSVYDPQSIRNLISDKSIDKAPVAEGYEHAFSTALTGSLGAYKKQAADRLEQANLALDKFADGMKNNPKARKKFNKLKNADNVDMKNLYEAVTLKTANPELKFSIDYALSKLNEIEGSVTFIGLSPNNDSHILSSILENEKIDSIIFYYYEQSEKESISSYFKSKTVTIKNVTDFWNK